MKHTLSPNRRLVMIAGFSASLVLLLAAENAIRYTSQPNTSRMTIDGTSTIHDWTVESRLVGGFFEAGPEFFNDPATAEEHKPKVSAVIPVRSIKSDKPGMDSVMHEAMKEKDHPRITYSLKEMKLKEKTAAGAALFDATGELTVAGVTKPHAMVVAMSRIDENTLKFAGTNSVKMTDFGIKPPAPSIGLGLIKTGDDVKLTFEWVVKKR